MTTQPLQLDLALCRQRQHRLCEALHRLGVDRAVLATHENVQYLTGFRPHRLMTALACLEADGQCLLVAPNAEPDAAAADSVVTFAAQWTSTLRQDQMASASHALADALAGSSRGRVGVEFSAAGPALLQSLGTEVKGVVDVEPELWRLRRRKDTDELAMIRRAIACTEAMYAAAREMIEPGIGEIAVYNRLHAAAVEVAGEPLTGLGADYQCNSPGGPPRERKAQAGELYILDLGPGYRGYWADNCRTFAVDRNPTDAQQAAWEAVVSVLEMVESTVRPGVSCRELFERAKARLDDHRSGAFFHHLGHGIGLYPHEAPHLNPGWDDVFAEGDVFTAEPGLYYAELRAGIRLEQDYLVTADGVERLTSFPLEL
jgi:Xaa-Pro dipeptidase